MHKLHMGWIALVVFLAMPMGRADVFEGAQWLRDPVFKGTKIVNLYHREREKSPEPDGPQNVHTLFRKEVTLPEKPVSAVLSITGDDYYKFYINGYAVVQGPESGYPIAHPYYWLDVTEFLESGATVFAAHSYYQGLCNRVWDSGDNRSGFMMALDLTFSDGKQVRYVTDESWHCFQLKAFPTGETIGYKTQFLENVDMREMPTGWRMPGFDDTQWLKPLMGRQDHCFEKQITPPLQRRIVKPVQTKELRKGHYFYDFGTEIVGHTRIEIQGKAGEKIVVRHGEELAGPDKVRYKLRASMVYEEMPVLSGNKDRIEFYDYRAFRYMEIKNAPSEPTVWVEVRHHPFDPKKAQLHASDSLLEDIWNLCKNGVQMGSQGGFLDCPTREKGQYLGDAVITARSHLWLTGDATLTKKCLHDFALSTRIDPGMMAVAPSSFMQEIAEYSLQYPLMLKEYYRHSGDRVFVEHIIDTVFEGLFNYFARYENKAGLLENFPRKEKWTLVDWPENLRDGYEYDLVNKGVNTVLNAFYYGALTTGAELLEMTDRNSEVLRQRAQRIETAFATQLVDPKTGLYVDGTGSTHSSLHANAIPLFFGLTQGVEPKRLLDFIAEKELSCGVYIASYVIEACFKQNAGALGYHLITNKGEHSWHEMLKHGATTCMEAWGPDQKWNTSWCHPWSSCPTYLIAEYVMGLSPAKPGWKGVRIAPAVIPNLPNIELTIPLPQGHVTAQYEQGKGFTYTLPVGVVAEVLAPEGVSVTVQHATSHGVPTLPQEEQALLESAGWYDKVGNQLGLWISVPQQMCYLLQGGYPVWQARCATASAGVGNESGSMQTPPGWHRVAKKFGENAPWGQVFKSRKATSTVWKPGDDTEEDLVLTRILWLCGEEPEKNQGKNSNGISVDSQQRCIYIHGTNDEARIGTPSSHGCIRLRNDDVIAAFNQIPEGAPVYISAETH